MRGRTAALLIGLMVVLLILWNIIGKPWPEEEEVKQLEAYQAASYAWQGRYPEEFALDLLSGERFTLSETLGKRPILLTFFATWCEPCRGELDELKRFMKGTGREELLVLAINAGEREDRVRAFVSGRAIPFQVALDPGRTVSKAFSVESLPTCVFIGLDGRVALYQTGAITNADIVLTGLLADQRRLREEKKQISAQQYLAALKAQDPLPRWMADAEVPEEKVQLDEAHRAIAGKVRCADCPKSILDCACGYCLDVQRRLSTLEVAGKGEEEVLRELFWLGEGDGHAAGR